MYILQTDKHPTHIQHIYIPQTHTRTYIIAHTPVLSHSLSVLNAPIANSSPNRHIQCVCVQFHELEP